MFLPKIPRKRRTWLYTDGSLRLDVAMIQLSGVAQFSGEGHVGDPPFGAFPSHGGSPSHHGTIIHFNGFFLINHSTIGGSPIYGKPHLSIHCISQMRFALAQDSWSILPYSNWGSILTRKSTEPVDHRNSTSFQPQKSRLDGLSNVREVRHGGHNHGEIAPRSWDMYIYIYNLWMI